MADIAMERYKDMQDYFGDEAIAKTVLENRTEFKAWLARLRWNTKKVDELARKLKALEQEQKTVKAMRADIMKLQTYKMFEGEKTVYIERDDVLKIFDEYKTESGEEDADSD